MVKRQLHKRPVVPRVSGPDTHPTWVLFVLVPLISAIEQEIAIRLRNCVRFAIEPVLSSRKETQPLTLDALEVLRN